MADFQTHITSSGLLGLAFGAASHIGYGVPLPTAVLAGGLVTIGGVLPDVDSDNAIILRESLALVAAITPMMMLDRFREWGWTNETIVLASAGTYLLIRFGFGTLLKKYTVHRGMWHSIPAAGIAGILVFMLCSCVDMRSRMCKSTAIVLGYIWHLVLDEINSVESTDRGRVRIKRSFGTALKFFGKNSWSNITTYGKLIALGFIALVTTPNPWINLDVAETFFGQSSHQHSQHEVHGDETQMPSGYPLQIYNGQGTTTSGQGTLPGSPWTSRSQTPAQSSPYQPEPYLQPGGYPATHPNYVPPQQYR